MFRCLISCNCDELITGHCSSSGLAEGRGSSIGILQRQQHGEAVAAIKKGETGEQHNRLVHGTASHCSTFFVSRFSTPTIWLLDLVDQPTYGMLQMIVLTYLLSISGKRRNDQQYVAVLSSIEIATVEAALSVVFEIYALSQSVSHKRGPGIEVSHRGSLFRLSKSLNKSLN